MSNDPRTDEGLMLAFKDGDAAAFEVLYGRWRGPLYRYFLRQCRHAGEADELYQDVFMRVIAAAGDYEVAAKFSTWLYRIAHNRLIDHWRKLGREPVEALDAGMDDADSEIDAPAPEIGTPHRQAESRRLGEALVAAVGELPDVQREAFLLAEEGGLTLEEIGTLTGVGRETVKSRLRYATTRLRNALKGWR